VQVLKTVDLTRYSSCALTFHGSSTDVVKRLLTSTGARMDITVVATEATHN